MGSNILQLVCFYCLTIAFLMGHWVARYICLLTPLTLLTRFAALYLATLALLTHSIHRFAHSLRLPPCGTVEIFEYVDTL